MAITTATRTTPRVVPAVAPVGTNTVRQVVTMTTRGPTGLGEAGGPVVRGPPERGTVPRGLVEVLGAPVLEEVATAETMAAGEEAMTTINLEVPRPAMIATPSQGTAMDPAAVAEGATIPAPHPSRRGATPLIKAQDDTPSLEPPRGALTEVGVPRGNIRTPRGVEATEEPVITTEEA